MPSTQLHGNRPDARIAALFLVLVIAGGVGVYAAFHWTAVARARKLRNPVPATDSSIAAGMRIYGNRCSRCHGENGDGRGEKASELSVAPADFTDAQNMSRVTDGELYWEITKGRSPMPSFETRLTDVERWEAVDYIRTFAAKSATAPGQAAAPGKP
ncbi:MAG: cytochrome c [Candidatus Acidiferrales bacterium]